MSASTIQFISQVKLGELRRQRSLLLAAYDDLARGCEGKSDFEAIKTLFHGLRDVKVAGKPLHPDLGNLEFLLRGAVPSDEIVAFWLRRLRAELETGRLRADIVYLFGALLGEWGDEDASRQAFLDERDREYESLLRHAQTPPAWDERRALDLLGELFAGFGDRLRDAPGKIAGTIDEAVADGDNAAISLGTVAQNIYLPAEVRAEAKRFRDDHVLGTEFVDALRVVTRDPRDWAWPMEGVAARALWTRNKWRLYLDLSLVQIGLVTSFGNFWSGPIEDCFSSAVHKIQRLARYHKLLELNAPDVIIENERRMLREVEERVDLGWYEPADPWDGSPTVPAADEPVKGVAARRASEQADLRDSNLRGYYGDYGVNPMVSLVNAEVLTLRAAFPDRPLFVAKLDVKDYFASIPHPVLAAMLRGLGLPQSGLDAVGRFLAVPYRTGDRVTPARCGVPMNQDLSHWLAEWLLRLMERYVHGRARVRVVRQIDDVCLLSPSGEELVAAWRAVEQFLEACGLTVNGDKCGALALGAALPAGLPDARPRWGLLELTEAGDWAVHGPTFQTFLEDTRKYVAAKHALLARVTLYNAHMRFLTSSVGLALDLGDAHRRSANDALRRFEAEFFGDGMGIVAGLHGDIRARYLEGTQLSRLPEGWMYWPVTAGGLGLRSAFVLAGQYQQAYGERSAKRVPAPPDRPANWQNGDSKWSAFYDDRLEHLEPAKPAETKVTKALVDDFIARGQEISGGKQQGLSDYWRWVLCVYGPEILERFGTFRFLLTDLVPLQLIHEHLLHDSSLEG
jgi:hypothetical protein